MFLKSHRFRENKNLRYALHGPGPTRSFDLFDDHKMLGILISQHPVDIYHTKSVLATKIGDIF